MKESTTSAAVVPVAIAEEAWQEVGASFERFCLTAGIAMRPALWPCRGQGRAPLGEDQGQGRLPWRQDRDRTPSCARP
jgi:hypothetical protein